MMNFEIVPRVGLGALKFGMSRHDVGLILDSLAPVQTYTESYDKTSFDEFRRLDIPNCTYVADKLAFIGTSWHVQTVTFSGLNVYAGAPRTALQVLENANGGAAVGLGSVVFRSLMISTTNFFDEQDGSFATTLNVAGDERTLSLSTTDEWTGLLSHLNPVSFM